MSEDAGSCDCLLFCVCLDEIRLDIEDAVMRVKPW